MADTLSLTRSTDNLLVTLDRWEDGHMQVWNVEFLGEGVRNRVTFSEGRSMFDVFATPLVAKVTEILRGLDHHTRIYSDTEFELSLPGVRVRGLRLMIAAAKDRFDRVLLRFREVVGDLPRLFRAGSSMDPSLARATDRIAVNTLSDIVLPVCDIADHLKELATLENGMDDTAAKALSDRVARLSDQSQEMRLYLHLLMRYIEESETRNANERLEEALSGLFAISSDAPPKTPGF